MSLAMMPPGQAGTVVAILAGSGLTARLDAVGIRPGVRLVKTSGLPFGGPVTVGVGNVQLALGRGMAAKILLEIEPETRGEQP